MIFVVGARDAGTPASIWAYNNDNTLAWTYDTGAQTYGIIADGANNVYAVGAAADNGDGNGTRNLWKLSSAGVYLSGTYAYSSSIAYDIDIDDNFIYVVTNGAAVRLTHALGSETNIVTSGANAFVAVKVDSSGNIYIGSGGTPQNLYKYNSALALQWIKDDNNTVHSIALLANEDIITGSAGKVRKYLADGSSGNSGEWEYTGGASSNVRVVVDSNDVIYAAWYNTGGGTLERFAAFNSSGTRQWGIDTTGDLDALMLTTVGVPIVGGDVVSSFSVWEVDTTNKILVNLVNTTTIALGVTGDGITSISLPTNVLFSKKLTAIANNQFFYESIAGTMSVLSGSTAADELDYNDGMDMVEAYEKMFVVNGGRFKVADFGNTMIETDDIKDTAAGATSYPLRGVIITGAGGAQMIVDYIDAIDGAAKIYGNKINSTAFVDGELVSGTNSDSTVVKLDIKAGTTETAGPHWYNWTVYGGDTAFGALPTFATVIKLYRGRIYITGDRYNPHQWYLSRQGNPWDFNYAATDAQSPVAGNNADVGEIGDIQVAAIPYKDDFLIMGCTNSMWLLAGDPMEGGSLDPLDLTTGIYGPKAYCWDGEGNLYFWGVNGIYKMTIPGTPQCISQVRLPNIVADEAIDPSTHRIVFAYDLERVGITIFITNVSTDANSNYFYDLRTGGFFPDSYPTSCSVHSAFYYNAEDGDYRKLLLGCTDGFLRYFNPSKKDDDAGAAGDMAINSYVKFGPIPLAPGPDKQGVISGLNMVSAGGAASGSQSDSDDVEFSVFTARSAAEVIEKLSADTGPNFAGTFSAPGIRMGKTHQF